MEFIRARTEEQIANRQEEIINACDVLFTRYGYEGVKFQAISEITSIRRPTLYLYYKTKDEVLLDLLKKEMLDWDRAMQKVIQTTETMTKERYCAFLTESIVPRDKMLRLLVILCTDIENQCSLEKLTGFKKEVRCVFVTLGESLDKYFPKADISKKNFFITALFSYIHGLYPLANLSKKQVEIGRAHV
jgi:AcrR family transcriptional regulator